MSGVLDSHQRRREELREQLSRLTQADQNLSLAEQAMREEAERSEASKSIAALRTEHAALLRIDLLRTKLGAAIEQEEQRLNQLMSTQIRPLLRSISSFYVRTQGVPFVDSIGVDPTRNVLRWLGQLADAKALSAVEMSQGQRQDLALSIFLARARREQGTFILDEPLAHLDDLNRVAFFDTLRAMVAETKTQAQPFRLVITTASWSLVRHLRAKFLHVRQPGGTSALRILELVGNPRNGIEVRAPH
jgi:exonuclease SbcC